MLGVAHHQASASGALSASTDPVAYSLLWPSNQGTGSTPPTPATLLNWSANTVNIWLYVEDTNYFRTVSFKIGGLNIGYSAQGNTLYVNECTFTGISNQWVSILYRNAAGGETHVRVNDQLPVNRTFAGYAQDSGNTVFEPSTANQAIGALTQSARNVYETPATPGNYQSDWRPTVGLIRYSTEYLDVSTRDPGTARWTAYNDLGQPGRDTNNIWRLVYSGQPTRTQSTVSVYLTPSDTEQTQLVTHSYHWPSGFNISSQIVDDIADSANYPMRETLGLKINTGFSPTRNLANSVFEYPALA